MRAHRHLMIALAAVLGLGLAAPGFASSPTVEIEEASRPAEPASVIGVVVSEVVGLQLDQVQLTLRSVTDETFLRRGATDARGSFSFTDLPAGTYSLEARRPGFQGWHTEAFLVPSGTERRQSITLRRSEPGQPQSS